MTIYVEDLIERMAGTGKYLFDTLIPAATSHQNMFNSFSDQMFTYGLTEKQKKLCVSLLKNYILELSSDLNTNIEYILNNNIWRTPSRYLLASKKIEIVKKDGRNSHINLISPYNSDLIKTIKDYKTSEEKLAPGVSTWNSEDKIWTFPLCEQSIKFFATSDVFKSFNIDTEIFELYQDIKQIENNIENYVPLVTVDSEGHFFYANIFKNIPQPDSNNLINVLLHARKYGITMWSDYVDEMLQNNCSNKLVKKFLELSYQEKLCPSSGEFLLDDITPLIDAYENILFVIPINHEFKYVKKIKDFLLNCGYSTDQISVLFRLETSIDKNSLNDYIKEFQLNNELSDNTRFLLVSSKLPKPLIEFKKQFDLIITFGLNSSNCSLQTFLQNHHNVISMHPASGKDWKHVQL